MKRTTQRLVLAASLVALGLSAVAPVASANSGRRQVSSAAEISEDATFHDLIRHNRDARNNN
ncbi:MAG: hypothetical protein AB8B99_18280 [Phormidesmis sp.]